MGIFASLKIFPDRINPDLWLEFYQDSLFFLQAFPGQVVDLQEHHKGKFRRLVLSHNLESNVDDPKERHWRIVGTLEGRRLAESFALYADIQHYCANGTNSSGHDILDETLETSQACRLFFNKTQGQPYHFALLAIAMLAEQRFPGAALAGGDIDPGQSMRAQTLLRDYLGEQVELALVTDGHRLYQALAATRTASVAVSQFCEIYRGDRGQCLTALIPWAPRSAVEDWLKQGLVTYQPNQLGTTWLYIDWLNATGDLMTLGRLACLDPEGPGFAPEDFANGLSSTGIMLAPEEGESLNILTKPEGESESIASLLTGSLLFELGGLESRHCTRFLGEEAVFNALKALFGSALSIDALRTSLRQKQDNLRESTDRLNQYFSQFQQQAEVDPETGAGESLLDYQPGNELSENQISLLSQFAAGLKASRAKMRAQMAKQLEAFPELLGIHEQLNLVCQARNIALSEAAWGWIDAEQDEAMLEVLLMLAGLAEDRQVFVNFRDAVMEKQALCAWVCERSREE